MTFEKVKEIIMDTINCSEDKITLEANLKDDLGIDSLDSMELMMAVKMLMELLFQKKTS